VCEVVRLHAPADASTILVIGHEPGMPDTAMTLDPAAHIPRFPTSAYAVVETETAWDQLGLAPDATAKMTRLAIPRE
jgi:phosphohistidine phosphatase